MERREMGFGVGFEGLRFLRELMLKHLAALSVAIVAMVAAIVAMVDPVLELAVVLVI